MQAFQKKILEAIRSTRPLSDREFEALALRTYEWQRRKNTVYGRYCDRSSAGAVRRWADIPALPVLAYKFHRVAAFAASKTRRVFMTSGTTRTGQRGKHPFEAFRYYDAAIRSLFSRHVLRGLKNGERIPIVFLTASGRANPESSLSHMGDRVQAEFGQGAPFYALGKTGLDTSALTRRLTRSAAAGQKVLIYTTTFALADYLDHLSAAGIRIKLPKGSRIMETGGYKGRRKEVARPALVRSAATYLGIPATHVINEYGMTELSSQFYDLSLTQKRSVAVKSIPPWVRVLIIHPVTGKTLAPGKRGLIRIIDLANQGSCLAIQTEDEGRLTEKGLEVLGRRKGADLRGCSLSFEELRGL